MKNILSKNFNIKKIYNFTTINYKISKYAINHSNIMSSFICIQYIESISIFFNITLVKLYTFKYMVKRKRKKMLNMVNKFIYLFIYFVYYI